MMNHTRTVSANPRGTAFSRFLMTLARVKTYSEGAELAARMYPDSPEVALVLRAETQPLTIGNSPAFTQYGLGSEVLQLIAPFSIVSALTPLMRRVPFKIAMPRQTQTITVGFVNENSPIPVVAPVFDSVALDVRKLGAIVPISEDLLRASGGTVEVAIRVDFARGFAAGSDQAFYDPSVMYSITRGITPRASSGTSAAQILSDLSAMTSGLGSWGAPRWTMRPRTSTYLAALLNAAGQSAFPGVALQGGTLLGIPVVTSANLDPLGLIVLADYQDICVADDGVIDIQGGRSASIVMSSTPASSPQATALQSMWQSNNVAFRAIREINWARGHDASVQYMAVSY